MTILTVAKEFCAYVGVLIPQSLFSGIQTDRTRQEILALANECAQRVAYDQREWTRLKKECVYTGALIPNPADPPNMMLQTAFNIPADYKRMLLTANVWRSTSTQCPMRFIPDTDEWLTRRASNEVDAWGEWTMLGGQMHIYPPMEVGTTARYAYLDRNCVALNSGGFGDAFLNDLDSFVLDERLLRLCMIWQWKVMKGSPYAEELGTYSDALAVAAGADKPSPIIVGHTTAPFNARVAYPWPVPT